MGNPEGTQGPLGTLGDTGSPGGPGRLWGTRDGPRDTGSPGGHESGDMGIPGDMEDLEEHEEPWGT